MTGSGTVEKGKSLKRGALFLTAGNIAQAAVAFAVNLVMVRYISPAEFGRFAVLFAEASLVYAVVSLRVNVLILRVPDDGFTDEIQDRYFSAFCWETLAATLLVLGWAWLTGDLGPWGVALVLAVGVRHWMLVDRTFFERRMPYVRFALVETGVATASHLLALGLVLAGLGWQSLFLREIALSVIGIVALAAIGGVTLRRFRWLGLSDWREMYRDARGVWVDGALDASFQRLSLLLAGYVGGDAVAGYLFQAQRLAGVPHMILGPYVNRIIANWFARTTDGDTRLAGRARALRWLFGALILGAVVGALLADPVVPWLLGEPWRPVVPIFIVLTVFIVFASPFEVLRSYCLTVRQARWLVPARLMQHVGLVLPLALLWWGIADVGAVLAAGISLAYALGYGVLWGLLKRYEARQRNQA